MMAIAERLVLVCQYHSCSKYGSEKVLAEFVHTAPAGVTVQGTGCLGLCGSGPIVLVIPDQVYYWRVPPNAVSKIIAQHLLGNQPVRSLLHPRLHAH